MLTFRKLNSFSGESKIHYSHRAADYNTVVSTSQNETAPRRLEINAIVMERIMRGQCLTLMGLNYHVWCNL